MNGNLDTLIGKKALYHGLSTPKRVIILGWAIIPNSTTMWPQLVFANENGNLGMDNVNQFEIFSPGV